MSVVYNANVEIINAEFTANRSSAVIPTAQFKRASVHLIWADLTGTIDATVAVQGSNDGVNFDSLASATSITGASGNDLVLLSDVYCSYIQVVATKNNVTGGTIKAILTFKE